MSNKNYGFIGTMLVFLIIILVSLSYYFNSTIANNISIYDKVNVYYTNISVYTSNGNNYIFNYPFIFLFISLIILMSAILFLEKVDNFKYRYTKVLVVISVAFTFIYNEIFMADIEKYLTSSSVVVNSPNLLFITLKTHTNELVRIPDIAFIGIILFILILVAYTVDMKIKQKMNSK